MSKSYRAILVDGRLRWLDDVPEAIRHGAGDVLVQVVVDDQTEEASEELASLLDEIAAEDPYKDIEDPVEWQRELRRERDLRRGG